MLLQIVPMSLKCFLVTTSALLSNFSFHLRVAIFLVSNANDGNIIGSVILFLSYFQLDFPLVDARVVSYYYVTIIIMIVIIPLLLLVTVAAGGWCRTVVHPFLKLTFPTQHPKGKSSHFKHFVKLWS